MLNLFHNTCEEYLIDYLIPTIVTNVIVSVNNSMTQWVIVCIWKFARKKKSNKMLNVSQQLLRKKCQRVSICVRQKYWRQRQSLHLAAHIKQVKYLNNDFGTKDANIDAWPENCTDCCNFVDHIWNLLIRMQFAELNSGK